MNRTTHQIEPEEVMAYLDGELAAERAAVVAAHIEACAQCAAVVAELRGVSAHLATWTVTSDAADTTKPARDSKLPLTTTGQPHPWRKRIFGLPQWAWGLAGSAAVLLFMVGALTPNLLRSRMEVPSSASQRAESMALRVPSDSSTPAPPPGPLAQHYFGIGKEPATKSSAAERSLQARGPMMIRTASVTLETKQFDATRAAIERIVRAHGGHIGQLQTAAPANQARTLTATLRIPADRLDAALAEVKKLGRVMKESQGGDEVTQPYADLVARIANARSTEQRLVEILRTRTGKVTEVLEVEREIAEVREQIERMDAQRKSLENQVALSTVSLELREEFEKQMEVAPPSTGTLLWNAMVDGYDSAVTTALGLALFLLRAGPSLLLWAALLFFPARFAWRRIRMAGAQ